MTEQRTTRVRLLVILILLTILALSSFWVLEVMRRNISDSMESAPNNDPDYYVDNFKSVKISLTGQARYNITGKTLTHYPLDDTYRIEQPLVHNFNSARPTMTMRSDQALVENKTSKIHLYHHAYIDRPAAGDYQHFHVKSEYLLLLPDDEVVQTDQPAEITFGTSTLNGTGMIANNGTRQLHLSSHVQGMYPAPPH